MTHKNNGFIENLMKVPAPLKRRYDTISIELNLKQAIMVLSNLFLRNVIGKELLLDIMLFFLCIKHK